MKPLIVLTNIYSEFWGTKEFKRSIKQVGLPLHNAWPGGGFTGNGTVLFYLWEAYRSLRDEYSKAIYSDGADTYFLESFEPPDNKVIFSAEKNCYPHPWIANQYEDKKEPWCYLNGGNHCGPIELIIEFFERYDLNTFNNKDINGQLELSHAYIKAKKDGFPIELDQNCEYFQTTAFEDPGDFLYEVDGKPKFYNIKTETYPKVLHGNGRTDMTSIYRIFKKEIKK